MSWEKQWAWKEGEEKKTRLKKLVWKQKRKAAVNMIRNKEEAEDYQRKETRWIFDILKEERCAKYIIYACTRRNQLALSLLQAALSSVGIYLTSEQPLPVALAQFRSDETITFDSIMKDEDKNLVFHSFWRMKIIRGQFQIPGQHLSSTDTDEEKRGQGAARSLEEPGMVEGFAGLSTELQNLVANYTMQYDTSDSVAAGKSLRHQFGVESKEESDAATIHPASSHSVGHEQEESEISSPERSSKRHKPNADGD